ncbi:chemotaxis protein CheA, partial [Variovorax sp. PvP013]|uniref:chemotaxis protein CheA n=1 Tax=Variovorax sp. PvP013 TaxID=3156435 RepID=UPI003D1E4AF3
MSEFLGIFVEEAREHLQEMEAMLLALRIETVTTEDLNKIFRAAHSIKGGSATFGLHGVTELAHVLESLLDRLRDRRLALTTEMVDALLRSTDTIGAQISEHEGRGTVDAAVVEALCECIRRLTEGEAAAPATVAAVPVPVPVPAPAAKPAKPLGVEGVAFGFFDDDVEEPTPLPSAAAPAAAPAQPPAKPAQPAKPMGVEGVAFGFFDDDDDEAAQGAAAAATASAPALAPAPAPVAMPVPVALAASAPKPATAAAPVAPTASAAPAPAHESNSIRVGVEKVDQIINLVGELVITQAMLAQCVDSAGTQRLEQLKSGLDQLDRNTRALQEAAMAIRMMPISAVFNRFPRVVRDVAARLGKEVELKLVGEGTELDKGLIERIVDPLTHLVRNSLDHGLEAPAERIACGKPVRGTITLRASHQGGNIV